jgi:hypothetical protein
MVPCFESFGLTIPEPPSKEVFLETYPNCVNCIIYHEFWEPFAHVYVGPVGPGQRTFTTRSSRAARARRPTGEPHRGGKALRSVANGRLLETRASDTSVASNTMRCVGSSIGVSAHNPMLSDSQRLVGLTGWNANLAPCQVLVAFRRCLMRRDWAR